MQMDYGTYPSQHHFDIKPMQLLQEKIQKQNWCSISMDADSALHQGIFEGDKNVISLTWPGLKNQQLSNHLHTSIATVLGNMGQERKNFQSTNHVKSELEIE